MLRLTWANLLAGALWWFWWAHSHASEGRRWLDAVLSLSSNRTAFRAKALYASGILALLFDSSAAPPLLQEALSIYQELGHRTGCAATLLSLGWLLTFGGDYPAGRELVEQSVALYRAEPVIDRWGLGFALIIAELLATQRGNYAAARMYGKEALALFRELGQPYGISQALNSLGDIARLQGDYTAAATWYAESLALLRRSTIKGGIPSVLHNMGYVLLAQDQLQRAAALFAEGLTLQQENGDQQGIAECLAGLAAVAANRQESERAARLFGAVEALRAVTDGPIWPAEQAEYERHRAAACAQLDEATFVAVWAAGRELPLEQAIVYALEEYERVYAQAQAPTRCR